MHWPEGKYPLEEKISDDWYEVETSTLQLNKAFQSGDLRLINKKEEGEILMPLFHAVPWVLGTARAQHFVHPASSGWNDMPRSRRCNPLQFTNTAHSHDTDGRRLRRSGWLKDPISGRIKSLLRGDCLEINDPHNNGTPTLIMICDVGFRAPRARRLFYTTIQKVKYMPLLSLNDIRGLDKADDVLSRAERHQQTAGVDVASSHLLVVDTRTKTEAAWDTVELTQLLAVHDISDLATLSSHNRFSDDAYFICGVVHGSSASSSRCKSMRRQDLVGHMMVKNWSLDKRLRKEHDEHTETRSFVLMPYMLWKDGHEAFKTSGLGMS